MPLIQPPPTPPLLGADRLRFRLPRRLLGCIALLVWTTTACTTAPLTGDAQRQAPALEQAQDAPAAAPMGNGEARQRAPTLGGGTVGVTIELPDTAWSGGYQSPDISTPSGGIATLVYGAGTQFNVLQASFLVEAQPFGSVELRLEGMDSPGADKTPIGITVNDQEIYAGPNLLPDSEPGSELEAWGSYTWSFNAQMLHPGHNTILLRNLAVGGLQQPPFFVLDYAELTYQEK